MELVMSGLLRQGAIVTSLDLETFQVKLLGVDPDLICKAEV